MEKTDKTDKMDKMEKMQKLDSINDLDKIKVDESMKLLFIADSTALIQLVNNALGRNHTLDAKLQFLPTEFISADLEKLQADLIFMIDDYCYHLEFQTKYDKTMAIRMIEYGLSKVRQTKIAADPADKLNLEFPMPLVIQVEQNINSMDELSATIGVSGVSERLKFKIPVINMWKYTIDDVITRKWYLLAPYCLIKYRQLLKPGKVTSKQRNSFRAEIHSIMGKLLELRNSDEISSTLFEPLMKMIVVIANHINNKFLQDAEIKKELMSVNSTLNPLGSETVDRILNQGREEGEVKGMVKILIKEFNHTPNQISEKLHLPLETVNQIITTLREEGKIL